MRLCLSYLYLPAPPSRLSVLAFSTQFASPPPSPGLLLRLAGYPAMTHPAFVCVLHSRLRDSTLTMYLLNRARVLSVPLPLLFVSPLCLLSSHFLNDSHSSSFDTSIILCLVIHLFEQSILEGISPSFNGKDKADCCMSGSGRKLP